MKIKVVIPARYGSSRLPGKPLLLIDGKPVFAHVFGRVIEAGIISDDIVLATDDVRIANEATNYNIPVVMTKTSHVSGTDRLNEVALSEGWNGDTLVINVQGDEPLIPSSLIRQLVDFTCNNQHFDMSTAITPLVDLNDISNPNIVKVALGENGRAVYFSRSPIPFNRDDNENFDMVYRHIGIYSYSVKALHALCSFPESKLEATEKLEQLRALSNGISIGATIVESAPPHGIDTRNDYLKIKEIMENK